MEKQKVDGDWENAYVPAKRDTCFFCGAKFGNWYNAEEALRISPHAYDCHIRNTQLVCPSCFIQYNAAVREKDLE